MIRTSDSTRELVAALVAAQPQFGKFTKQHEAHVESQRGRFQYRYGSLDGLVTATLPALNGQGLTVLQLVDETDGLPRLFSRLAHISGEFVEMSIPLKPVEPPQQFGSFLTYMRRYCWATLVGIAAEEDDDGAAAEIAAATKAKRSRPGVAPSAAPVADARLASGLPGAVESGPVQEGALSSPPPHARRRRPDPDQTTISDAQRKYLFATATEKGWPRPELKTMLTGAFGIDSTSELRMSEFDTALQLVNRGPAAREPGQEG